MQELCFTKFLNGKCYLGSWTKNLKKPKKPDLPTLFFWGLKPESNLFFWPNNKLSIIFILQIKENCNQYGWTIIHFHSSNQWSATHTEWWISNYFPSSYGWIAIYTDEPTIIFILQIKELQPIRMNCETSSFFKMKELLPVRMTNQSFSFFKMKELLPVRMNYQSFSFFKSMNWYPFGSLCSFLKLENCNSYECTINYFNSSII